MKNGLNNKKKIPLIIACIIWSFVLTGSIFYQPELRNADDPFIDLEGSMGAAISCAETVSMNEHSDELKEDNPEEHVESEKEDDTEKLEIEKEDDEVRIIIKGEEVSCKDEPYTISQIEKMVENGEYDGKKVIIVDDYAEVNTYKKIKDLLDKRKNNQFVDNKLSYEEEPSDE